MEDYRQRLYRHYESGTQGSEDSLRLRAAHLRRLIRRHFPPAKDAAILDLGCGHGTLLEVARGAGYRNLVGIDCSPQQVAEAGRRGITGIMEGNVLQVLESFPAESQDVVVAFDVIEHFTKDELLGCLDQVWRVLKSGGKCIIHAPNGASPFCGRIRYGDFTHELAVTQEALAQVGRACGFSRISCYEDEPVPHGVKSGIRWLLWKGIRSLWRCYLAVETGAWDPGMIFSQNLFCVAIK